MELNGCILFAIQFTYHLVSCLNNHGFTYFNYWYYYRPNTVLYKTHRARRLSGLLVTKYVKYFIALSVVDLLPKVM